MKATLGSAAPARGKGGAHHPAGLAAPGHERIEIPPGVRQTSFSRELLAADAARSAVAVVDPRLVAALSGAAVLLLLATMLILGRELASGARALASRPRAGRTPITTGA